MCGAGLSQRGWQFRSSSSSRSHSSNGAASQPCTCCCPGTRPSAEAGTWPRCRRTASSVPASAASGEHRQPQCPGAPDLTASMLVAAAGLHSPSSLSVELLTVSLLPCRVPTLFRIQAKSQGLIQDTTQATTQATIQAALQVRAISCPASCEQPFRMMYFDPHGKFATDTAQAQPPVPPVAAPRWCH
jgi:hypothetical protein